MNSNFITNIEICADLIKEYVNLPLIYYTHIPSAIVSLIIAFLILFKNRTLIGKVFFLLSLSISIWIVCSLITWTSVNSLNYMFFWSFFGIINSLIFTFCLYFAYLFIFNKDVDLKFKFLYLIILVPIFLITPTKLNLINFVNSSCVPQENINFVWYFFSFGLMTLILVPLFLIKRNSQNIDIVEKRKNALFVFGVMLFILAFFFTGFFASYLYDIGLVTTYDLEPYGLLGVIFLMSFLTFIIVRFRAFNIKLLGAQALVWAMVILIGSQFLFIESNINKVLNSVTFVAVSIAGLILVRSVKKVDDQRELLAQANQNQQSLLHFITHQVKGYLTKSRNIFDGMVNGDYDPISEKALQAAKYGFDSDTRGVETVLAILKASDLKTGKTELKKEKTNLSAIVAEVVEFRKEMATKKNLDLSFEIEPNINIQVDALQIKEVFKNLISNSILYTPTGTVHVVLKREDGKVKFSVVDTGIGLSPEDKNKLFTEGGKGQESISINVDSTGYGLYIAKKIVEQHQGKIGAISEGRGKGSEFYVILPDVG